MCVGCMFLDIKSQRVKLFFFFFFSLSSFFVSKEEGERGRRTGKVVEVLSLSLSSSDSFPVY